MNKFCIITYNVSVMVRVFRGRDKLKGWVEVYRGGFQNMTLIRASKTKIAYRISSNNSCPSIYRLPRIIAPPPPIPFHPSGHLLFLLRPLCQVKVESDVVKLISDDSRRWALGSIKNRKTALKIPQNRKTAKDLDHNRKPNTKPS